MTQDPSRQAINCSLVVGGRFHDFDYARLELLQLLAEDERIRTKVFQDYSDVDAIVAADFIVTYTCDLVPDLAGQEKLRDYVAAGGRWYALHGTNSILRFTSDGRVDSPAWAPLFMETLGSQFMAHPPIGPFRVDVAAPDHPLVQGISSFETVDEHYLVETYGDLEVLLDTGFEGSAHPFTRCEWPQGRHPVLYLKSIGDGSILYLTLGHCRGHYDLKPLKDYYPNVDRCSWEHPVFRDLLKRGIGWAKTGAA